ncbi:hypothetical protein LMH87_007417 [Akanthomyces muscarius]|uniref:Bacteriophage T5 Orf172 DNA-binding domain-containing protein n=1 Tax=Akanthomyces muscarius TaxID=2231603 RepID=A0A9W8URB6_AKAMU|nr:hypothetical protein LMH87_007417 [Akanthomyces muscarius]KAJ4165802.1 hypothetical protein LMH87_007417 [Akanthomyces muscarius]
MPFVANTPESLLARSDSKDPKSTCRGITSSGRPCRRPLAAATRYGGGRHLTAVLDDDPADESLYCWQHKEQASHSAASSPGPKGSSGYAAVPTIREERTSLDTLADRLGLVDIGDKYSAARPSKPPGKRPGGGASGTPIYPPGFQGKPARPSRPPQQQHKKKKQPASQLQLCCCLSIPIEQVEDEPAEKPKPKPSNQPYQQEPMPTYQPQRPSTASYSSHYRPPSSKYCRPPMPSPAKSSKSETSVTAQLKHLIPNSLDAATASLLMAELVRPVTESDEPGYIYMFWLVQEPDSNSTQPRAPVEAARSLLAPPSSSSPARGRRASDTVSRYASQSHRDGRPGKQTMLLKIGRAANVQRRMNQWQRQCGYDIEVLRYYPYASSSSPTPTPSPGRHRRGSESPPTAAAGMMTPHAKRVERLVHIELTGMGFRAEKETCKACGRDHREWFEVASTRDDVRKVDEVIRRWTEWDCREE